MKMTESNSESEYKVEIMYLVELIKQLESRVIRMERTYDALDRRLEGSERHPEDEGWFD